jgi:hypothetical protein
MEKQLNGSTKMVLSHFLTYKYKEMLNLEVLITLKLVNFENEYSTTGYGLHSFIDSDSQ